MTTSRFEEGERVRIINGHYEGKVGTYEGRGFAHICFVRIEKAGVESLFLRDIRKLRTLEQLADCANETVS